MTHLGQVAVVVVDLTGGVRVGNVSRRKVEEREVDALSRLGDKLDGTRRHAVSQWADTGRRRRGRRGAVREDRHAASASYTAGWSVAVSPPHRATNIAQLGGYYLLPGVETLIVIR